MTSPRACRIALLNPNTNAGTTRMMLGIAQQALPAGSTFVIEGRTAPSGEPLIVNEAALATASVVVQDYGETLATEGMNAIIVSAFGDPGLLALRKKLAIPVTGIAEAGISEAAAGGRRYAIVTTTPLLRASLHDTAALYGHADTLVSVRITEGDAAHTMQNMERMANALLECCHHAIRTDGADAIVIGGGPLAHAAQLIAPQLHVPLIEPVAAAVRLTLQRCQTSA